MPKFEHIIFDMDGTIIDPLQPVTSSVRYALEQFGIIQNDIEELKKFIGPPLHESFSTFYDMNAEESLQAVRHYRKYLKNFELDHYKLYPGMDKLINELNEKGSKLYVATSKPQNMAELILDNLDLKDKFAYISGSKSDESGAEKKIVIKNLLENSDIDKDSAVMIGDRSYDIIGAKEHGIKGIGILHGYGSEEEFRDSEAWRIVNDTQELKEVLI